MLMGMRLVIQNLAWLSVHMLEEELQRDGGFFMPLTNTVFGDG